MYEMDNVPPRYPQIPCELNVRPEHVSTQVPGYSLDHVRICLQLAKMIASSLFGCPNRLGRGIEVFLVKLMVVKSSIVVPVIIVMWDLKFIVELVVIEVICVEKL